MAKNKSVTISITVEWDEDCWLVTIPQVNVYGQDECLTCAASSMFSDLKAYWEGVKDSPSNKLGKSVRRDRKFMKKIFTLKGE